MAMSADGKISTRRREPFRLGSKADRELMDRLRSQAHAVVIGSGTLRCDGYPLIVRNEEFRMRRLERGLPPHPLNVLLSTELDLPMKKEFFLSKETAKLIFTTRAAPEVRRLQFTQLAEVVVLSGKQVSPRKVINTLAERGLHEILLEGGGELNFSFLKRGLVDELYLTVTPLIIGGRSAPTVIDGAGFIKESCPRVELLSARRVGEEVFLHYRLPPRP